MYGFSTFIHNLKVVCHTRSFFFILYSYSHIIFLSVCLKNRHPSPPFWRTKWNAVSIMHTLKPGHWDSTAIWWLEYIFFLVFKSCTVQSEKKTAWWNFDSKMCVFCLFLPTHCTFIQKQLLLDEGQNALMKKVLDTYLLFFQINQSTATLRHIFAALRLFVQKVQETFSYPYDL